MAVGWSRDGDVQEQIDASVRNAVDQARRRMPEGDSLTHCGACEAPIPEARRKAVPVRRVPGEARKAPDFASALQSTGK